jgi:mono/diheme cytochrome c family protein
LRASIATAQAMLLGLAMAAILLIAKAGSAEVKLENDQDVARFFGTVCGYCHEDGGRRQGKGPALMGTKRTDEYMMNRIATGRAGRMPAYGATLSAENIEAIIHYIRNLQPHETPPK